MKIDSKLQFPNDSQPEHVSGKRSGDVAQKGSSQTTGISPATGEDTFELSGTHNEVHQLTSAVSQVPEVRAERIAALQGQVRNGEFKPDSEKIAEAVLSEHSSRKFKA